MSLSEPRELFLSTFVNQGYDDDSNGCRSVQQKGKRDSMIYADIDIDKLNHSASVISPDGKVLAEPFEFSHAFEGLRNFSLILVK